MYTPGRRIRRTLARLRLDERGNITILFGLAITVIVMAAGGGIDLSRAYQARQQLSEVATLSCQYASRPSIVSTVAASYSGTNGGTSYSEAVKAYINATLATQNFSWAQTTTNPFTYVAGGPADVTLTANVPATFMRIVRITQLPVGATAHCYDSPANLPPNPVPNGASPYLVREGFESGCNCLNYIRPDGTNGTITNPTTTIGSSPTYTGSNGNAWYVTGYCLERDPVNNIKSTVPEGRFSAELDCDNHNGSFATAGNSSISTQSYLPVGNYELRYFYAGRVDYPNYNPTYLCGSTASDLSWANDTNSSGGPVANALRTNQLNVYLDLNTTNSPPQHTTIDRSQQLAGSNLIDMCVYSTNWVERSIRIVVTNPGYYWLSFAADGQNDSYGAQLDNIRLCIETCPTALQDNFPWANNTDLFEDTFESPVYTSSGCFNYPCSTAGNMNNSKGTSGATSGWPNQAASGWATAPYNQMDIQFDGKAAQGTQFLELDATAYGTMTTSNRYISRPFLLDPGYYKVSYYYRSNGNLGYNTITCGATPSAAGFSGFGSGPDTNVFGMFMGHAQLVSTPVGGGDLNSATQYNNPPNGALSSTPNFPLNAMSFSSFDASQPNALLDTCGYASSWQLRSANILITKPGYYWLSAAALGKAEGAGAALDDVKLTALGSPYMSTPPSNRVTVPVPDPQPGSRQNFTGFYIIADPFKPPAAP